MSPYEHWEVFVTEDWWETDLDLWHYERFINTPLSKDNSITTWKIYKTVLEKERIGHYLWKNIQVIPHVVDEVKEQIFTVARKYDITIIEIWWTIWDIEWPHFIEAARQLKATLWKENVMYAHVVPVLYLNYSWEFKSKQIQHSYANLASMGIHADMLVCRTEHPLPESIKEKLSLFCDIDASAIIENRNVESIYQIPALFQEQGVDRIILEHFGLWASSADITLWNQKVDSLLHAPDKLTIGMVWKYAEQQDSYMSVTEALKHAGIVFHKKITIKRLQADDFTHADTLQTIMDGIDGLVIPGWFGSRWMEWKIAAAQYARTHNIPFLWLCLWLQMAVIEYARNVLKIQHAHTVEADQNCQDPVISYMPWQSDELLKWWTMRLGAYTTHLDTDSRVYTLYSTYGPERLNKNTIQERHRHRFEVNPAYYDRLEQWWLHLCWKDATLWLVEFIEITNHAFYVATQAHPEFTSSIEHPHPLFVWFIHAAQKKNWA